MPLGYGVAKSSTSWDDVVHSDRYLIVPAPTDSSVHCGDKIVLPSELFEKLGERAFSSDRPLLLRIAARTTGGGPVCYGTVLEFSAEPGTVILPDWMEKHLGLSRPARALVSVCLAHLFVPRLRVAGFVLLLVAGRHCRSSNFEYERVFEQFNIFK